MRSKIQIQNLKCTGCAHTIKTKLESFQGISGVDVDVDTAVVTIDHKDMVTKESIQQKLKHLGYPVAQDENGILSKAKSYLSCAVGRLSH
nr:heavy metal-associated domain-containing protein [Allomuricauda sp.]